MDDDLRHLVSLISDTGMRLSEAAGLMKSDFNVDCDYPHVVIESYPHRSLKTLSSERTVPLVGNSLWAAIRIIGATDSEYCFPRYTAALGYKLKIRKSKSFKDVTNTMVELESLQPKGVVPLGSKYLIEDWRIFCSDSSVRLKPNRELIVSDLKAIFLSMRTALAHAASKIVLAHEVEDIVQETYVKLCLVKNSKRIKHPKSYLYKMAQNLARDHVKTATYRLSDSLEDMGDVFIDQNNEVYRLAVSSEEFTQFCETVRYLPIQCKRAFVLKKVYGYSQKEIAKELKISQSTVEKHVALGLKRCAEKMHSRESSGQLKREY